MESPNPHCETGEMRERENWTEAKVKPAEEERERVTESLPKFAGDWEAVSAKELGAGERGDGEPAKELRWRETDRWRTPDDDSSARPSSG